MSLKRITGAVIVGNMVYTSGTEGGSGDIESQIRECLKRLERTLVEAGTSLENVVKATVYLSDLEYKTKYLNTIWSEVFGDNKPSRTCVEAGLGSVDVEIEMIAYIPE